MVLRFRLSFVPARNVFTVMPMADRISTLPDSILCNILSFLPTEQAVATSLLSKRWKPLWLAIPTLNFDDEGYSQNKYTYSRFLELVNTVMFLRDGEHQQSIKKFSLKCESFFCSSSVLNTWVKAATQRKVEHLSLYLPYKAGTSLPSCVLTCKTLVVLKLSWLTVDSLSSVSFPSLKILHLIRVRFQEKRYIVEILSACPVLEVLMMKYLKVTNSIRVQISELKLLPKLVKADFSELYLPLKSLYNAEFLRARVLLKPDLHAHNFSNLTYMELTFVNYYWDWLIKLLCYCPSLQNLVIDKVFSYFIGVCPADENWVHPQVVPDCVLSQLKRLRIGPYRGKECELQFTRYILKNAKVLRKVTICTTSDTDPQKKLEMIKELSLCPRGSVTCELYFE